MPLVLAVNGTEDKKARLMPPNDFIDKLHCLWDNILWTDETKVELLGMLQTSL